MRVGWTNNAEGKKIFQLKGGEEARIVVLEPDLEQVYIHTWDKKNYVCLENDCPFCNANIDRKIRYGVMVFKYRIMNDEIDHANPGEILIWTFTGEKYTHLYKIQKEHGALTGYDLKITCNDERFQKLTITNCRGSLLTADPELGKIVSDRFVQANRGNYMAFLGRHANKAQIQKLLGGGTSEEEATVGHKNGASAPAEDKPVTVKRASPVADIPAPAAPTSQAKKRSLSEILD